MSERQQVYRDPMSRAAARQLLRLGVLGTAGFVAVLALLSWAASLTGSGVSDVPAIDVEAGAIAISIRQEPPQLDHTRMSDVIGGMIVGHILEGLLRYDRYGGVEPGVAERWDIRTDGATFFLREDALWSDGKPVTAHDFVFSWRRVADPATASRYAFIFYAIKNGEAINSGKMPPEMLGVRAIDDRTLEVEFENPVAYFDKLVAFPTFMPIREDFYVSRNGRYAADAEDLLYNGPFVMTRWVHGANLRMEKNPLYWNRDEIRLNTIDVPYITEDASARINLFWDGKIANVDHMPVESLDLALKQRWPIGRFSDGSVWYVSFNQRPDRLTANYHLRRALQLVNNSSELVYKVLKVPSYAVAQSMFPSWLRGGDALFQQEYPPPTVLPDIDEARRELALAKQELGVAELPPLVLLSDDTPIGTKHSEYLQNLFMRTLGIEVRLDKQIFKQRIAKSEAGEFDMAILGWGPDFDDPLTFGDVFASWNLVNYGRYNNPALDEQVRITQRALDSKTRMDAFGEIQRILFEDAVILMSYERSVMFVEDPRLKGVSRRPIGPEPDYTGAYLVASP
jgi:oligopeptide transport system substrate-binding protein